MDFEVLKPLSQNVLSKESRKIVDMMPLAILHHMMESMVLTYQSTCHLKLILCRFIFIFLKENTSKLIFK